MKNVLKEIELTQLIFENKSSKLSKGMNGFIQDYIRGEKEYTVYKFKMKDTVEDKCIRAKTFPDGTPMIKDFERGKMQKCTILKGNYEGIFLNYDEEAYIYDGKKTWYQIN